MLVLEEMGGVLGDSGGSSRFGVVTTEEKGGSDIGKNKPSPSIKGLHQKNIKKPVLEKPSKVGQKD